MGVPPSRSTSTSTSASPGPTYPQQQPYGRPNISSSPPRQSSFTFSAPPPVSIPANAFAPSPIAPAYSPITPKVQPILPVLQPNGASAVIVPPADEPQPELQQQQQQSSDAQPQQSPAIAPATFIPAPAPQPFSSEDSTDAIALRAAISALQFQRKKAKDDLRSLEGLKKAAVEDPSRFRDEVKAGRLREQRSEFGGLRHILDREDSDPEDDEDEDEDDDEDMAVVKKEASQERQLPSEIPDSQPSRPSSSEKTKAAHPPKPPDFTEIPGPQTVVRMPAINWEKYHIVGSALDQMHEQQRKWPGHEFAYDGKPAHGLGREQSVAAPYSPFLDVLANGPGSGEGEENRKDSVNLAAFGGTVSEHPMETRRGSSKLHP